MGYRLPRSFDRESNLIKVSILPSGLKFLYMRIKINSCTDWKKILFWNSEKNIAIKKIPTVQKCFKVVERHCLKNLSDLLKC